MLTRSSSSPQLSNEKQKVDVPHDEKEYYGLSHEQCHQLHILGVYVIANVHTILRLTKHAKSFDPHSSSIVLQLHANWRTRAICKTYAVEYIGLWVHQHWSRPTSPWKLNGQDTNSHIYFVWRIKEPNMLRDLTTMFRDNHWSIYCSLIIREIDPRYARTEVSFTEDDAPYHAPWLLRSRDANAFSLRSNNNNVKKDGYGIGYYFLHNIPYGSRMDDETRVGRPNVDLYVLMNHIAPFLPYTDFHLLDYFDVMADQMANVKYHQNNTDITHFSDLLALYSDENVIIFLVPLTRKDYQVKLRSRYERKYKHILPVEDGGWVALPCMNDNQCQEWSMYDPPLLKGGKNVRLYSWQVYVEQLLPNYLEDYWFHFHVNQEWMIPGIRRRKHMTDIVYLHDLECYSNIRSKQRLLSTPIWFDTREDIDE